MVVFGKFPDYTLERKLLAASVSDGSGTWLLLLGFASFVMGVIFFVTGQVNAVVAVVPVVLGIVLGVVFAVRDSTLRKRSMDEFLQGLRADDRFCASRATVLMGPGLDAFLGPDADTFSCNRFEERLFRRVEEIVSSRDEHDDRPMKKVSYVFVMRYPLKDGGFGYFPYRTEYERYVTHPEDLSFDVLYATGDDGKVSCLLCDLANRGADVVWTDFDELCSPYGC